MPGNLEGAWLGALEATGQPVVALDAVGKVKCWTSRAETVTGCQGSQVIGKDFATTCTKEANRKALQRALQLAQEGTAQSLDLEVAVDGGASRAVSLRLNPWRAGDDSVIGVIGVFEESADRSQRIAEAEWSDARLSDLLDRASGAIFAIDCDLVITEWNFAIADLSGLPKAQVTGKGLMHLVYAESGAAVQKALELTVKNDPMGLAPFKMQLKPILGQAAGITLMVGMCAQIGKDGAVIGALCVGQVVPAEAAPAAASKGNQGGAASVVVDPKTKGMVMHELRSPLHGIIGLATTLAQDKSPMQKALNMIGCSAERILELVTNLMDYWALAQEPVLDQPQDSLDLSALINECLQKVESIKDKRGKPIHKADVEVVQELGSTPSIKADHQSVASMVNHLLENAFKFTHKGKVTITTSADDAAQLVCIEVKDTGIGCSRAKLNEIFEPFRQEDSSESRKYEGIGLGLTIVREVVRTHGGTYDVQSEQGSGSTYRVKLPYRPGGGGGANGIVPASPAGKQENGAGAVPFVPPSPAVFTARMQAANPRVRPSSWLGPRSLVLQMQEQVAIARPSEPDLQKLRMKTASSGSLDALPPMGPQRAVSRRLAGSSGELPRPRVFDPSQMLIMSVDDDHVNQEVMRSVLEPCGFKIEVCMNGTECLEKMEDGPMPDLILLDLMMPGLNGFDVLQAQRKGNAPERLPIIMVSAKNQTSSVVKGFELGCNDWIHKPFDRQELIARLKHHLHLKNHIEQASLNIPEVLSTPPPASITTKVETSVLFMIAVLPDDSPLALQLFEAFENLAQSHKISRTEMIGTCYLAVAQGDAVLGSADAVVQLALGMEEAVEKIGHGVVPAIRHRIGIHTDSNIPPVIGKFPALRQYPTTSFFGATVKVAKHLSELPSQGNILLSRGARRQLSSHMDAEVRNRRLTITETQDHYVLVAQGNEFHPAVPILDAAAPKKERRQETFGDPAVSFGETTALQGLLNATKQQLLVVEAENTRMRDKLSVARMEELSGGAHGLSSQVSMGSPSNGSLMFLQWQNAHLQAELRQAQTSLARERTEAQMQASSVAIAEKRNYALQARVEHLELDLRFRSMAGLPGARGLDFASFLGAGMPGSAGPGSPVAAPGSAGSPGLGGPPAGSQP